MKYRHILISAGDFGRELANGARRRPLSGSGCEILTTSFTWVATLSAIQWEGCRPAFCDIESGAFNSDHARIEAAITPRTRAILPCMSSATPAMSTPSRPSRRNTT